MEKKQKLLSPAAARREIAALERLHSDGDISLKVFWEMKEQILGAMGMGHE